MARTGRPLKFQTVAALQEKIDAYFAACDPHVEERTEWLEARDKDGNLLKDDYGLSYLVEVTHMVKTKQIDYGIAGLAHALGTNRETLLDYEHGKRDGRASDAPQDGDPDTENLPDFSDAIKLAKYKIEAYLEIQLRQGAPVGSIFNLKNNFGWKDRTEVEESGTKEVVVTTRRATGREEAADAD